MKISNEVMKEEIKLNEETLTDLPLAEEQANETKAGVGFEKQIQVESWSFGATNSSNASR